MFSAKTNEAALPGTCQTPTLLKVSDTFVLLEVHVPADGGARIKYIMVEVVDMDESSVRLEKMSRDNLETDGVMHCRILNLRPRGVYIFRCRAESLVGVGQYSEFTEEVKTLLKEGEEGNGVVNQTKAASAAPTTTPVGATPPVVVVPDSTSLGSGMERRVSSASNKPPPPRG